MKNIILLSCLVFSPLSFAFEDSCMDRLYIAHSVEVESAKEAFKKESEDCFRFPDGEDYYACTFKAKEKFDKAVEKANIRVNQGTKFCLKFPFA